MPLVSQTFDQLLDFTRTTAGSFVGSNGLIQNTPASVNLLLWTQQFDNAAWAVGATTVTANTTVAPDGTSTADKVVATTADVRHVKNQLITVTSGVSYTLSFYVKAAEYTKVYFADAQSGKYACSFDLAAGTAGTPTGAYTGKSASITNAGNGWYRCELSFTANATESSRPSVIGYPNTGATLDNFGAQYIGDDTSGIFVWGAQLEVGSTATTYTRNNGGVFPPRFDYDPVTLAPKGIQIEEQRTNLFLQSETFDNASWNKVATTVTANATVSPDGTADADALVEDAAASTHFCQQFFSGFTSGVAYTFSVYVKPSTRTWTQLLLPSASFGAGQGSFFDLTGNGALGNAVGTPSSRTITAVGNGWYRVTVTATATATAGGNCVIYAASANGTISYAGNSSTALFLYGAQLEAGAFPTSYIPTVASQVTRTRDDTSIVAPNFAPFYNQSEGTFVVEADMYAAAAAGVLATNDGTSNNYIMGDMASGGTPRYRVNVSTVSQAAVVVASTVTPNTAFKMSFCYALNSFQLAFNGGLGTEDTSGSVPTVDRLLIGATTGGGALNGHIRSVRYFPVRLSNAQLQALTA